MNWIRKKRDAQAARLAERAYQCLPVNIPEKERAPYARRLARIAAIQLACGQKREAKRISKEIERILSRQANLAELNGFGSAAPEIMQLAQRIRNRNISILIARAEISKRDRRRVVISLLSDDLKECKTDEDIEKAIQDADQVVSGAPEEEQDVLRSMMQNQLIQSCCENPEVREVIRRMGSKPNSEELDEEGYPQDPHEDAEAPSRYEFRMQAILNFPASAMDSMVQEELNGGLVYQQADRLIGKAGEIRLGFPKTYLQELRRMQASA